MRKQIYIFVIIFLVILNFFKSMYVFNFKYETEENFSKKRCMIIQKEKEEEDLVSYLVKYNSNKFILNVYENEYVKVDADKKKNEVLDFRYGEIIEFRGKITIPKKKNNPYEFNYKKYLNSNNIVGSITTYEIQKKIENVNKGNIFFRLGYSFKEYINNVIDRKLPAKEGNLLKSMLYGDDLKLDENIKNDFSNIGSSHLLAVSGMHLVYIIKVLNILTKNMNEKIKSFFSLIVISMFCIISSMSISVMRASIMAIVVIFGNNVDNKKSNENNNSKKVNYFIKKYKNLIIAFLIIFIHNPYVIFNMSFQMSFLSTLGIMCFSSFIKSFFLVKFNINSYNYIHNDNSIYNYIQNYILEIISLSLSANILIFPLQIYYFGKFETISFFANIFLSPIISFQFFLGFCTFFSILINTVFDITIISNIFLTSNIIVLKSIIFLVDFFSKINYLTIFIPRFNYLEIFLYYFCIILNWNKKYKYKFKFISWDNRKIINNIISFVTILSFLYSILMYVYRIYFEEYIYFFNVGQGNMAIIRNSRKVVIIDIGSTSKNVASNVLEDFLKAKAIYSIDGIFLTHFHEDHVNGIYNIIQNFNVKKVIYALSKTTEKGEYDKVIEALQERKVSVCEVSKNDKVKISNITVYVLMPFLDKTIVSSDMINSNSAIYLLEIDKKQYLFMGDATKETEFLLLEDKEILKSDNQYKLNSLKCIQIGHHGSKTSTSEEFLIKINEIREDDCIAIISSEKKKYGHPHKITLELLEKYNFEIKITEEEGAVKVK